MISIVIPTLNAAATLPATITALQAGRDSGLVGEILVIDGGSTDRTMAVAEAVGAKVLHSAPGRGGQLQRGAVAAKGEWFLFLHGDTILAKDWLFAVENFISDEGNRNRAAAFRFAWMTLIPRPAVWKRSSPGAAPPLVCPMATRAC